jgi:hypothetical protein
MKAVSLSESRPRSGTGSRWRISRRPAKTARWPRVGDGAALAPTRGDVDRAQRVGVRGGEAGPAVCDEVNFQEAGLRVIPLGERADGDLTEEQCAGLGRREPARSERAAGGSEDAIDRGRADLEQDGRGLWTELENAEPGQGGYEFWQEGAEPATADVPAGLPGDTERVDDLRSVLAGAMAYPGRTGPSRPVQQPQEVLAMVACDGRRLREEPTAFQASSCQVSGANGGNVLTGAASGHVASLGNTTFEATILPPVANWVRQR